MSEGKDREIIPDKKSPAMKFTTGP